MQILEKIEQTSHILLCTVMIIKAETITRMAKPETRDFDMTLMTHNQIGSNISHSRLIEWLSEIEVRIRSIKKFYGFRFESVRK